MLFRSDGAPAALPAASLGSPADRVRRLRDLRGPGLGDPRRGIVAAAGRDGRGGAVQLAGGHDRDRTAGRLAA